MISVNLNQFRLTSDPYNFLTFPGIPVTPNKYHVKNLLSEVSGKGALRITQLQMAVGS